MSGPNGGENEKKEKSTLGYVEHLRCETLKYRTSDPKLVSRVGMAQRASGRWSASVSDMSAMFCPGSLWHDEERERETERARAGLCVGFVCVGRASISVILERKS